MSFSGHGPVMVMCFLRHGNALSFALPSRDHLTGKGWPEAAHIAVSRLLRTLYFVPWYFTWLLPQGACRGRKRPADLREKEHFWNRVQRYYFFWYMQIFGYKFAICRIFNVLSKGSPITTFTRMQKKRVQRYKNFVNSAVLSLIEFLPVLLIAHNSPYRSIQ